MMMLSIFAMHLLVICTSFENCVFSSFAHLLNELFVLLLFNILNSFYILDINPLPDEQLEKVISHSICFLLTLIIVSFFVQKFLI
jgi:hypothetical protein